jgi:SAM-dependent methyltransferase
MPSTRFFDAAQRRIVYVGQTADDEMWDRRWAENTDLLRAVTSSSRLYFVPRITRRFLRPDQGPILEGGCGTGVAMWALQREGYRVTGIDYAKQTVQRLRDAVPELDVRLGDVRKLDFQDASFAGVWSLGVIEHFWAGYEPILREAHRVLEPNGLLFLTFPHVSPLRALKARLGQYPAIRGDQEPEGFYQFALTPAHVLADLRVIGFSRVFVGSNGGLKGLTDEVPLAARALRPLLSASTRSVRAGRYAIDRALSPFSGHTALIVARKTGGPC